MRDRCCLDDEGGGRFLAPDVRKRHIRRLKQRLESAKNRVEHDRLCFALKRCSAQRRAEARLETQADEEVTFNEDTLMDTYEPEQEQDYVHSEGFIEHESPIEVPDEDESLINDQHAACSSDASSIYSGESVSSAEEATELDKGQNLTEEENSARHPLSFRAHLKTFTDPHRSLRRRSTAVYRPFGCKRVSLRKT